MGSTRQDFWEIHDELNATPPPTGPEDRVIVARLEEMLTILDRQVETAEGRDYMWSVYVRSIARSRMILGVAGGAPASREADLANADAMAVFPLLRDTVLRGDASVKPFLGSNVQRLATILHWRPDPDLPAAQAVEQRLSEYLRLSVPERVGVSAAVRLAQALAELVESETVTGAEARSAVRACASWVDRAFDLLQELPDPPPPGPDPLHETIAALGSSVLIASTEWDTTAKADSLFKLISRRWRQMEALAKRIQEGDSTSPEALDIAQGMVTKVIIDVCDQAVEEFEDGPATPRTWGTAVALRTLIHRLPPQAWDRGGTAAEILRRRETEAGEHPLLQVYLDAIEMGLIRASIGGLLSESLRLKAEAPSADLEPDETMFASALLLLGTMHPQATPGYLAATMSLSDERPPAELEAEVQTLLSSNSELSDDSAKFEFLAPVHLNAELTKLLARPGTEAGPLREEVWRLIETICLPGVERNKAKGGRLMHRLFIWVARMVIAWPAEQVTEVLDWVDECEALLRGLEVEEPILELPRAELAFALTARDRSYYSVVNRAANALVSYIEQDPGLPDDQTAFDNESLIHGLRLLVISEQVERLRDPGRPHDGTVDSSTAHLRALAEDASLAEDDRRQATEVLAEIEVVRLAGEKEFSTLVSADWEELVKTRAVTFLLGLLEAEETDAVAVDPAFVQRAIANALAQSRSLETLRSADEGRYLEALTTSHARDRLGMRPADALHFGRVAADLFDSAGAEAAEVPMNVVLNLQWLSADPTLEADYRELAEEIGERFVSVLLDQPLEHPALPRFMLALSGLAQNLGAVRTTEYFHRQRLALAAHLLAVRQNDTDSAAFASYETAEFFRLGGALENAERWMEVYDGWRARGGLADDQQLKVRQAIEFDRKELRRAQGLLASDRGEPTHDLAPGAAEDDTSRMAYLANAMTRNPEHPIDERDAAILEGVAEPDLPPLLLLHHWALALALCLRAAPSHPQHDLISRLPGKIGEELLDRRRLPAALNRTAALPALEALVEAALAADDAELARRALHRVSANLNELFLSSDLGPSFLSARPTHGNLRGAAFRAFDRVDRELAIEIAETGRMKLLSSIATAPTWVAQLDTEETTTPASLSQLPETLIALLEEPSLEGIDRLVHSELDDDALAEVVRRLALPWTRLATSRGGTVTGNRISDEIWRQALIEPSLAWLTQSLAEDQLLIYPFLTDTTFGAVVLAQRTIFSFFYSVKEMLADTPEDVVWFVMGSELRRTILTHLAEVGLGRESWDMRFVAWDSGAEVAAQQTAVGFWFIPLVEENDPDDKPGRPVVPATIPTARLLAVQPNTLSSPPQSVAFLGDPTEDLPGPWVEGIAWADRFGDRLRPYLGRTATREAVVSSLRECDLVVISGHAFGDSVKGSGLRLADGDFFHAELLPAAGEIRASAVILSCCAAASLSKSVETEMIGLTTALLALGVRQVLAPLVPIDDPAAGVIGVHLAAAIADGCDLGEALLKVTEGVLRSESNPASTRLPADWARNCPHDQETLDARAQVSRGELLTTLREFSVFGSAA